MANQRVNQGKQNKVSKTEKYLAKYKGSEALFERYKSLVENSKKGKNGGPSLAEFNGERLIGAFTALNYTVNWDDTNTLNSDISELSLRSLDILERVIADCPENIDDYINVFESICTVYKKREYAENVIPLVEISLSIMNGWKNFESEEMESRLRVLSRSINSCIRMISKLNRHGISERLDDNVFHMYPARKTLVQLYLNRELTALGDSFDDETEKLVMSLFSRIDDDITSFIDAKYAKVDTSLERFSNGANGNGNGSLYKIDPAHVGRHIRMSRKIALFLGKKRIDLKESHELLSADGLESLHELISIVENNPL